MEHSRIQESMVAQYNLWYARYDWKWMRKYGDARRRKKGKVRRIKPQWKK